MHPRRLPPTVALAALLACSPEAEPSGPPPVFELAAVESEFVEVVPCKHSHEHELRHVRILADSEAAAIFQECVLDGEPAACPADGFSEGALFVKFEYEREGCRPDELLGYTASLREKTGAYPEGLDWRWQRLSNNLDVLEDGAPKSCLNCHVDHCSPPYGYDLRCHPD